MKTNRITEYLRGDGPRRLIGLWPRACRLLGASRLGEAGRLKAGDRVRVRAGALAGVEGTVVARCGRGRLIVSGPLLQAGVSLEIAGDLLEPIT